MSFLNEYLEITGICFDDPLAILRARNGTGGNTGGGTPQKPTALGNITNNIMGGGTPNTGTPQIAVIGPGQVSINGQIMTLAQAQQLLQNDPRAKEQLDSAVRQSSYTNENSTSNQTGSENRNTTTNQNSDENVTGSRNSTGTARKYMDVPTPEEFLDDFQNGFAAHVKSARQSGALSLNQARWLMDNPDIFFNDYLGELSQRAARGEQIFQPTKFDPSETYLGTRKGDVSQNTTRGQTNTTGTDRNSTTGTQQDTSNRSTQNSRNGLSNQTSQDIPNWPQLFGGTIGQNTGMNATRNEAWRDQLDQATLANVDRWRPMVEKYFQPQDVDKALYVIAGESGGNPTIPNSTGSGATGLFQILPSHGVNGNDPETAIRWAANQVYNVRGDWGDWGEGVTYNGEPFGVLGTNPYPGNNTTWANPNNANVREGTGGGEVQGGSNGGWLPPVSPQQPVDVHLPQGAPQINGGLGGRIGTNAQLPRAVSQSTQSNAQGNSNSLQNTLTNITNNSLINKNGNQTSLYNDSKDEDEQLYARPKMGYVKSLSPLDFLGSKYPASSLAIMYEGQKGSKRASVMPAYGTTSSRRQ